MGNKPSSGSTVCCGVPRWIVELEKKEDGKMYLNDLHHIEIEDGLIISCTFYCFLWNLMKQAAEELNVELIVDYFYHFCTKDHWTG